MSLVMYLITLISVGGHTTNKLTHNFGKQFIRVGRLPNYGNYVALSFNNHNDCD